MQSLTFEDLVSQFVLPSDVQATVARFASDIAPLAASFAAGAFTLVEDWPIPEGPPGLLRGQDRVLAHGSFARPIRDGRDLELVVVDNGWPIEWRDCPGPFPPAISLAKPSNYWITVMDALAADDDALVAVPAEIAGLLSVVHGRKPLVMVDSDDEERIDALAHIATAAALATFRGHSTDACGDYPNAWFLEAARTEPFSELVDLEAVAAWYEAALVQAGAPDLVDEVRGHIDALTGMSPADFLDRAEDLICGPYFGSEPGSPHTSVAGLVLGYWPPTTLGFHLAHYCPADFGGRYDEHELGLWRGMRWTIVDLVRHCRASAA